VLFCYDLDLTDTTDLTGDDGSGLEAFSPVAVDGEVSSFALRDIGWVTTRVSVGKTADEEAYKPNCNLVVIDFLVRHGCIAAESPHYLELVDQLRTVPML